MDAKSPNLSIPGSALLGYGFLAAPVAFAGFPLYVLAPDFYAVRWGVALDRLGFVLLALRLCDALQDPLIGYISDRYRPYAPMYMGIASVILCFSIYSLFNRVYFSPLLWFSLCVFLSATVYSVLTINMSALGALWTSNPHDQTRIATYRETFVLIGVLVAVPLPSFLSALVPASHVYIWFTGVLSVFMALGMVLFLTWYHKYAFLLPHGQGGDISFVAHLKRLSGDSKKLLIVYFISMVASSIPAVLVLFFVRDLLGEPEYTALFLMIYFISTILFIPLWKRISFTYGKYWAWLFSMLISVGSFIWAFFLGKGDFWIYGLICGASGMALGADLVLPPSILADQIHREQSESAASTHYALLIFIAKIALALASALSLPILHKVGFRPNENNNPAALLALSIFYALIPCVLKGVSIILLRCMFIRALEKTP